MAKTRVPELEGIEFRYSDDTWAFTGDLDVRQNGDVIDASARKTERVRRDEATMHFAVTDPPASLNPGNLGDFEATVERSDGQHTLTIRRPNATTRYRLESMNYD